MADVTSTIQDLYSQGDMLGRVLAFLKSKGIDAEHPSYEDLHVCVQMHARGVDATREHAEHAEICSGMHVLEVGCGIGGRPVSLPRNWAVGLPASISHKSAWMLRRN
jgi:hypothetical protein